MSQPTNQTLVDTVGELAGRQAASLDLEHLLLRIADEVDLPDTFLVRDMIVELVDRRTAAVRCGCGG